MALGTEPPDSVALERAGGRDVRLGPYDRTVRSTLGAGMTADEPSADLFATSVNTAFTGRSDAAEPGAPPRDPGNSSSAGGDLPGSPQYVVRLALQRGPYPYERRISVVAALDAATEMDADARPDGWVKAVKRACKDGGEVRTFRIGLDAREVAALFAGPAGARALPYRDHYNVRLALCQDAYPEAPPVTVAAVDEEMADSMGIDLGGPLLAMPMFYRRQVARALGEVRELIVSVPRHEVEAVFEPPPVPAIVCHVLSATDPRF